MFSADLGTTVAVLSLIGFAVQRALQIVDPFISLLTPAISRGLRTRQSMSYISDTDVKSAIMALLSFFIGCIITWTTKFKLLSAAGENWGNFGDFIVCALIISAGTEGANTVVKYVTYLKDSKKATITPSAMVYLTPDKSEAGLAQRILLSASVTGDCDKTVCWALLDPDDAQILPDISTMSASFLANKPGTYRVAAVSNANPNSYATAVITVI